MLLSNKSGEDGTWVIIHTHVLTARGRPRKKHEEPIQQSSRPRGEFNEGKTQATGILCWQEGGESTKLGGGKT